MRNLGISAVAVLLLAAGCSGSEAQQPASEDGPAPSTSSTPSPSPTESDPTVDTETPTPTPDEPTAPRSSYWDDGDEEGYLADMRGAGADFGEVTNEQLIAGGWRSCDVYDAGGNFGLAAAMTVVELPEDYPEDVPFQIATGAAFTLCQEHWDLVWLELQEG